MTILYIVLGTVAALGIILFLAKRALDKHSGKLKGVVEEIQETIEDYQQDTKG